MVKFCTKLNLLFLILQSKLQYQESQLVFSFQLKDQFRSLINPRYSFFYKLSPKFCNELTKIGHFQDSGSIFEVKYLLNLPENDFLLRIVN